MSQVFLTDWVKKYANIMVCNLKPGGKGIEVGKQYVQVKLTNKGKDTVVWNRYKKAVRSDYHQAMFYF